MTGLSGLPWRATNLQFKGTKPGRGMRIGVDVGGTFTDVVGVVDGRVVTAKVPSTPEQSEGVLAGIQHLGVNQTDIEAFAHGTTVATNALLERKGVRLSLIHISEPTRLRRISY